MSIQARKSSLIRRIVFPKRYQWWHAAALGVAANLPATLGLGVDVEYYRSLNQAPFAPPGWVFPVAWLFNNVTTLWGNLRLVNQPFDTPHRTTLIGLQGVGWVLFATFGMIYSGLQSPIMSFAWTFGYAVITAISMLLSWRIDQRITLSLLPLLIWLSFASLVAGYQVLYNPDIFFSTPAPLTLSE